MDKNRISVADEKGLTNEEVLKRQNEYGPNKISEAKGKPLILIFLSHFTSLMSILLWVGGAVAFFFTETPQLGIAIWLVNIINGLFSFFQEYKAGKATDALKKMLASYSRVIRSGKQEKVLSEEVVPGDVLLIEEGDKISADARLFASTDLKINQSALTGESSPVRKQADEVNSEEDTSKYENVNLVFAGTTVSQGSGKAMVTSIGMDTEFGKIAKLTQNMDNDKSPLEKELNKVTKQISIIAIGIGVFFFIAAVFFVKNSLAKSFVFALGMIVAFIPEGLLPTVTLSLAMAVQRMAKKGALVKKLSSVETLGSTTVICSDKTGTLTQNAMTVNHLWMPGNNEMEVTGLGYGPKGTILKDKKVVMPKDGSDLNLLLKAQALCCDAKVVPPDKENTDYTVLGDPTEACLLVVAQKGGLDMEEIQKKELRIRELPFDSSRKRMTTIHRLNKPFEGNSKIAYTKGAPKEVLDYCTLIRYQGETREISADEKTKIMKANDNYARQGLRVLGVAYRPLDDVKGLPVNLSAYTPELIEKELTFIGLVVMADPPRPEIADAIAKCEKASIRIIMITGDYGLTAESIAKRIGIVKRSDPRVITGNELHKMSEEELEEALKEEVIFARVAPEQKYRVVTRLQKMGNVVAVTGDGVNDAPALKKGDIGVAMGITGTDVAKESADMILTDDNFASIVDAVEEGRGVYGNIRKFLLYIFNSNMSEAVPSATFLFSKGLIPLPLTVMQILGVDLGTDMVPALGLGTELPKEGVMEKPPRKRTESLLSKNIILKAFFWYGLIEAIFSMGAYFFGNYLNGWPQIPLASAGVQYRQATTMALGAIIFCQIGVVLNCRSERESIFKLGIFSNKLIDIGIVVEIGLFCILMYIPIISSLFNTAPIKWQGWIYLILCPIPMICLEELRKLFIRRKKGDENL